MNNKPLILTAPRVETIVRLLKLLCLTALGLAALFGLEIAADTGFLPTVVCFVLFVPAVLLTACFFCGAADAVICLCDKKAVVLTDTDIRIYNLPTIPLSDINDVSLTPTAGNVKKKLIIWLADGKTVTVLRRTVNIPLPLLQEAILLRKNKR